MPEENKESLDELVDKYKKEKGRKKHLRILEVIVLIAVVSVVVFHLTSGTSANNSGAATTTTATTTTIASTVPAEITTTTILILTESGGVINVANQATMTVGGNEFVIDYMYHIPTHKIKITAEDGDEEIFSIPNILNENIDICGENCERVFTFKNVEFSFLPVDENGTRNTWYITSVTSSIRVSAKV